MSSRELALPNPNDTSERQPSAGPYWQPNLTWLTLGCWLVLAIVFGGIVSRYFLDVIIALVTAHADASQKLVDAGWGTFFTGDASTGPNNWRFRWGCVWNGQCRQVYRQVLWVDPPSLPWRPILLCVIAGVTTSPILEELLQSIGSVFTVSRYRKRIVVNLDEPIPEVERVNVDIDRGCHYLGTRAHDVGQAKHLTTLTSRKKGHLLLLGDDTSDWWQRYFLPHLLHSAYWGSSVVLIDPWASVQRAEGLCTLFARRGFDTQVFLPGSSTQTMHMHLLEGVGDPERAAGVARLIFPGANQEIKRLLLTKLLPRLARSGPVTLGDVHKFLTRPQPDVERDLAELMADVWEKTSVHHSVYQDIAARLEAFNLPTLDRQCRPAEDARLNIALGVTCEHRVFVYAGVAPHFPQKQLLSRLIWMWLNRNLKLYAEDLVNPFFLLPQLETYGPLPCLAVELWYLEHKGVGVCTSLPSTRRGARLYGLQGVESLQRRFSFTLRLPRFAEPGDVEPYRDSVASLPFTHKHTFWGDAAARLFAPRAYEPLLVPRRHRRYWPTSMALLQRKKQRPAAVSLLEPCQLEQTTGLAQNLSEAFTSQKPVALETIVALRQRMTETPTPALPDGKSADVDDGTKSYIDVDDGTKSHIAEDVSSEDAPSTGGLTPEDIPIVDTSGGSADVPEFLGIDVGGPASSEAPDAAEDIEPTPDLIPSPGLEGKARHHFKMWLRDNWDKAHEVFDTRLWISPSGPVPPFYYQKRSFALNSEVLTKEDLEWLSEQQVLRRELSLPGGGAPVTVVVVPQDLAIKRPSLAEFIRDHLHELEGSAPYLKLEVPGGAPIPAIGRYYPRLVLIQLPKLKEVLKEVDGTPLDTLKAVRLTVNGKARRHREIIFDDAPPL